MSSPLLGIWQLGRAIPAACVRVANRAWHHNTGCRRKQLDNARGDFYDKILYFQEVPVIKLDLVNDVVNRTGITKTKAESAVETVFESMKRALARGERIELRGFGVFNVKPRKTGIGRNPRTGAEVNILPGKAVRFKPGKELQSLP
jgi:DNA-binding protein HU-beta